MAKGRQYAEGLVGPLDRSYYETQRNVAKQTSQTNWEDLQNQYKNLQAKLKKEQEQANRDFANGLVQVAEGSLDRMNTAQDAMATSGLSYSGLSDVMQQADTTRKGKEVLDLMGRTGDVSVNVANQLASANTSSARKQAQLADEIADTLGQIGAGETSAQMAYNQGLAGIGEAMEAREAENDLAAKQRAANAAASARSKELKDIAAKEDDFYRRLAITELLNNDELDDDEKLNSLKILYDINNNQEVLKAFQDNMGITKKRTEDNMAKTKEKLKNFEKITQSSNAEEARRNYYALEDKVKKGTAAKKEKELFNYLNGKDSELKHGEAKLAYEELFLDSTGDHSIFKSGRDLNKEQFEALMTLYNPSYSGLAYDLNDYYKYNPNEEITYRDLAELLYGNK